MDTEPFILTPTTTFNCKKMSMADDNVIDDPHFYNFTIANTYISDTPMVLERPVFTIMVLRTHGRRIVLRNDTTGYFKFS